MGEWAARSEGSRVALLPGFDCNGSQPLEEVESSDDRVVTESWVTRVNAFVDEATRRRSRRVRAHPEALTSHTAFAASGRLPGRASIRRFPWRDVSAA